MTDDIIIFLAYPDTPTKLKLLGDVIAKARATTPYSILLATHLPVPESIISRVDYFLYDRDDAPSSGYDVYYHYMVPDYIHIKTLRSLPYHGLSGYTSIKACATFLRNKAKQAHFFMYDTLMDYPAYIYLAQTRLRKSKWFGAEYHVTLQNISGICGSFYSFNVKWYDNHLPEIRTWDEYCELASGDKDNLLGETWLHNYFADHGMIPSCYFVSSKEMISCKATCDIQTGGNAELGLKAHLSELSDHRLILFVYLYGDGQPYSVYLPITVNYNGNSETISLKNGSVYWKVIDKSGHIKVSSAGQAHEFVIDPKKEYTETVFKFADDKIRCLLDMNYGR